LYYFNYRNKGTSTSKLATYVLAGSSCSGVVIKLARGLALLLLFLVATEKTGSLCFEKLVNSYFPYHL